ncbi:MAG: hypothetical protein QOC80_1964, partial [Frankiaceae bacterium]|nr:hypothetical protein [Frankiaceae bacterium]
MQGSAREGSAAAKPAARGLYRG